MEINDAKYVISAPSVQKCPDLDAPEYAFIGRSNVGKSSLINMLTGRKALAKTSQTPGKTLFINYFSINNGSWYMVDLPGYGYAMRGKAQRDQLKTMIDGYVRQRTQMVCLFVLLDIRHKPQQIDLDFMQMLAENEVPFAMVFTKTDKLSKTAAQKNLEYYKSVMLKQWEELPLVFLTSSENKHGREEMLDYISGLNHLYRK